MSGFEGCPSLVKAYRSDVLAGSQKNTILAVPEEAVDIHGRFCNALEYPNLSEPNPCQEGGRLRGGSNRCQEGGPAPSREGLGGGRLQVVKAAAQMGGTPRKHENGRLNFQGGVKPVSRRGPAPSREGLGGQTLVKGAGSKS